jgi:hypothetical protein
MEAMDAGIHREPGPVRTSARAPQALALAEGWAYGMPQAFQPPYQVQPQPQPLQTPFQPWCQPGPSQPQPRLGPGPQRVRADGAVWVAGACEEVEAIAAVAPPRPIATTAAPGRASAAARFATFMVIAPFFVICSHDPLTCGPRDPPEVSKK